MTIPGALTGSISKNDLRASVPPVLAPITTIFSVVSIVWGMAEFSAFCALNGAVAEFAMNVEFALDIEFAPLVVAIAPD